MRHAASPPAGIDGRPGEPLLIGLAGQPNVGKSTVFNLLTGLDQHVGNWTGKTIERKEGAGEYEGTRFTLVDLPGTYSLTANSPEERVARDFVLSERPAVIVMIANAASLERNLYLLAELLALPTPVVLGLNMMDVARAEGVEIEPAVLEAALGIPVVALEARRAKGVKALIGAALRVARDPAAWQPARPEVAEAHRAELARIRSVLGDAVPAPYPSDWIALKLLEGDREVLDLARDWLGDERWQSVAAVLAEHEDAVLDVASGRYAWIGRMVRAAVRKPRLGQVGLTDRIDRYALHPVWGVALLLAVFGLVFGLTFEVGGPLQAWLDAVVVDGAHRWLSGALSGAPRWLAGLLGEGVLGGAGIVLTFVPILVVFFAAMALLEDTGYLARAAYVTDRYMHALGLHGKSFLPLCLGFGCNVPAVMGARVIEAPRARLLTILLTPLVPCSARLLVLAFVTPVFFGRHAWLAATAFVALNVVVLALVGLVLRRLVFRRQRVFFIMEVPLYHAPSARTIARFVWNQTLAFLRRAGTLILVFSVALWALASFPGPTLENSTLGWIGRALEPLGELMGLDWRLLVALLSSVVAKENAIAALGVLYGSGSEASLGSVLASSVSTASALSFLAANMLFIPCIATVAAMRRETGSWRWTLASVAMLLVVSAGAGISVYQGARWLGLG
jgi:ferrous iron transport protein B